MARLAGTPTQGLVGATLGFFIGFAAVSLYGPTVVLIREQISLSPFFVGLLVAAPNLSGSLLRIPFSAWVDTTGGRKPFLVLLCLSIVGMAGLSYLLTTEASTLNGHYVELLVFGVLSGCGIATFSVGISQTAYWFPQKNQGTALGIYAGVGNLAPGVFAFLLPMVALPVLGLAKSYVAWLAFLVVGTVAYALLGKNAYYFQALAQGESKEQAIASAMKMGQESFPRGCLLDSLKCSAAQKTTWLLVLIYFTSFGGFLALTGWLPNYWHSYFGVSVPKAGVLTAVYAVIASLVRVYGGRLSDTYGGEKTLYYSLCLLLTGSCVMVLASAFTVAVTGTVLMALGGGIANAAVFKLVPKAAPDAIGGASGWVGGLGALGGFVVPLFLALFLGSADQYDSGFRFGFGIFILLSLFSLLAVRYFVHSTQQRRRKDQ